MPSDLSRLLLFQCAMMLVLAAGCGKNNAPGDGPTPEEDMAPTDSDMQDMTSPEDMNPREDMRLPEEDMGGEDLGTPDDTEAPMVSISSGMMADAQGNYTLEGAAMDNVGVVELTYTINGGEPKSLAVDGTFREELTLAQSPSTIVVTAKDAAGLTGTASITVSFEASNALTPSFTITTADGGMMPQRYEHLRFDASATGNPENKSLTYTWDFGDGTLSEASPTSSARHRFTSENTYTIRLTVTADDGEEASAERMLVIADPPAQGTATFIGYITDDDGGTLADVLVRDRDGMTLATTDAEGRFECDVPRGVPGVLALSLRGYTTQSLRFDIDPTRDSQVAYASLKRRSDPIYLEDVAVGGVVSTQDGVQLDFPAGSIVDAETGQPVDGTIAIIATPVDMSSGAASRAFPGTYDGVVEDGVLEPIASYGVVEVELLQEGRALQVAPGSKVTLDIPIDPTATPNSTIPLWSFDELTGQWVQEGEGTVVSRNGRMVLESQVGHFSWWNADVLATGLFTESTFSFFYEDGTPYTPTDTAALEPRLSVITQGAPARPIYRRIRLENGKHILPDPLPMPVGRLADVEAIAHDETEDKLYYAFSPTAITADDLDPEVALTLFEVGGPQLPMHTLPSQDTPDTVNLDTATSTQFYELELASGEAIELAATASGSGRIVVRDPVGEPLLERLVNANTAGDLLFAPDEPGRYIIQVKPDRAAPGVVSIGANVITPPPISPGQVLRDQTLLESFTRDFIITANKNTELYARVIATTMVYWDVKLLAPNGRQLGTFSSYDYGDYHGSFNPIKAPNSNGYRVRVSGSPSSGDGTGNFDVMMSDIESIQGVFTGTASKTIAGFIGDPNDVTRPAKIHRYDFAARADHEIYARLQRIEPPVPNQPHIPDTVGSAPRLVITGANINEDRRVFDPDTNTTHVIARVQGGVPTGTGLIWVSTPEGDQAHYRLTVEQQIKNQMSPALKVGDCPGADVVAFALAMRRIGLDGEITLCETPDPNFPHEVLESKRLTGSLRGEPGKRDTTLINPIGSGFLTLWNTVPTVWENFTIIDDDSHLGGLFSFRLSEAATLRHVRLIREPYDEAVPNYSHVVYVNAVTSTQLPNIELVVEDVLIDEGFGRGFSFGGQLNVTMERVSMGAPRVVGIDYNSFLYGSNFTMIDSDIAVASTTGSLLNYATNGSITIRGNTFRHDNVDNQYAYLMALQSKNESNMRTSITVEDNTFYSSGSSHGGIDIFASGANQDVVFNRNTMIAQGHVPTAAVHSLTLRSGSGSVNHNARVENNVFIGQTEPIKLGDRQAFASMTFAHNSIFAHARSGTAPSSLLSLSGGSGTADITNNAFAIDTPHNRPVARADAGVSVIFTNNLVHNFTSTLYAPAANFTVTGELNMDPLWDLLTLIPMMGSPLLDAGVDAGITEDRDAVMRTNPPSIGAYELAAP